MGRAIIEFDLCRDLIRFNRIQAACAKCPALAQAMLLFHKFVVVADRKLRKLPFRRHTTAHTVNNDHRLVRLINRPA